MKRDDEKLQKSGIHINNIRRALAQGNAAVMVGAGFSRNAEGGELMADWRRVAQELWAALNPGEEFVGFGPGLVTQLGEQYARVFSQPQFEDLLKQLAPDDKVRPGDLHRALVGLPWSEVFTTNYDTLLERAAEDIAHIAYYTVTCREDIPNSKVLGRRRIVKLHGSFPSQRPFVFTEEEYRKYPNDFAPFVNLVRQSMLENIFCLVGFSGDDPNFLQWIGWVRDMLDRHALPIYLFLDKMPSLGQQKLLEARHVTPVLLPVDENDPDDFGARYRVLFETLSQPLKQESAEWGSFTVPQPVDRPQTAANVLARIRAALPNLCTAERDYPGWIVAPSDTRKAFERSCRGITDDFVHKEMLLLLKQESPLLTVVVLSQYVWQQGILLQSLNDHACDFAIPALRDAPCPKGIQLSPDDLKELKEIGITSVSAYRKHWQRLALGVLTWAREGLRIERMTEVENLIRECGAPDHNVEDRIAYEFVLLNVYLGYRDRATERLLAWKPSSAQHYMSVRRGALLAEMGHADLGLANCLDGLQSIRKAQKRFLGDTRLLSEESWALLIIARIKAEKLGFLARKNPADEKTEKLEGARTRDLAALGFDAAEECEKLILDLNAEANELKRSDSGSVISYGFDIDSTTSQFMFGSQMRSWRKVESAFAWMTLVDRVGLFPRAEAYVFDLNTYLQAAAWIKHNDSMNRVLSIVARTLNPDALKPKDAAKASDTTGWLSRSDVARLDPSSASETAARYLAIVKHATSKTQIDRIESLQVQFYLEALSRVIIVINDTERLIHIANDIIALLSSKSVQSHPEVWNAFPHALGRCLEAIPPNQRHVLIPKLLEIPIIPAALTPKHRVRKWDPFKHIEGTANPNADEVATKIIQERLDDALKRILDLIAAPREATRDTADRDIAAARAWERLIWLDHEGLLNDEARAKVGAQLWAGTEAWPKIPHFRAAASLRWPAPPGIDKQASFKSWVLRQSMEGFTSPGFSIVAAPPTRAGWKLRADTAFLLSWADSMSETSWTADELRAAVNIVRKWIDSEWKELHPQALSSSQLKEVVLQTLEYFDLSLGKAMPILLSSNIDNIFSGMEDFFQQARALGAPFWNLRMQQAIAEQNELEVRDVELEIASALLEGPIGTSGWGLMNAIYTWIREWSVKGTRPPELIVDAAVSIVAARAMPALKKALDVLYWVAKYQPTWLEPRHQRQIEAGLQRMLRELSYHERDEKAGIDDTVVPQLRLGAARLAYRLNNAGVMSDSSAIQAWLKESASDPLPEMRHLPQQDDD